MSDQAEAPPKKIGSLRDRIAAFEKAGAGSAAPAPAPPAPRPKPAGFSSWKPRPPSPTSGEPSQAAAPAKPSAGSSTADAKESITKGQSLKERMAALQGKGAFGGPPPAAPKPALEKPKWKPPPVVAAPKDDDDDDDDDEEQPRKPLDLEGIVKSPPLEHSEEKAAGEGEAKESSSTEGEEAAEVDSEEEERQRRAAIAARMARLGGARVGMAPPTVFGKRPPPPPKKRSSVSEDAVLSDTPKGAITSPKLQATEPETVSIETVPNVVSSPPSESTAGTPPPSRTTPARRPSEAGSLASIESSESHHSSRSPPASMPVPVVPRRAAPPRKKPAKPTAPPPPVPEADTEQQEEAIASATEAVAEPVTPPKAALATPLPTTPAPPEAAVSAPTNETPEAAKELEAASDIAEDIGGRLGAPSVAKPQPIVEESEAEIDEEKEYESEPEVELDEETKRHQVAERVARMGGINPFAAPVVPRRQSSSTDEAPVSSPPAVEKELEQPAFPPPVGESRRSSKLSDPTLSPLFPAAQGKRLSRGSVDSSRALLDAQEPTIGEPSRIDEGDESTKDVDAPKQIKLPEQSPTLINSETPQQTGTLVNEDSVEDDGASEYSDDDEDHKPTIDTIPAPPLVPHHPVHHSPEVPHRSVPPPPPPAPVEDEEEVSQKENEDMSRSQILTPLTKEGYDEDTPPVSRKEGTDKSAHSEEGGMPYDDSGSEYEEEEEIPPLAQPPVLGAAPSFVAPPPPPGRPNLPARSPPPPANRSLPPAPPAIVHTASQDSLKVPAPVEVLDDEEGDPIDPSFHSPSRRTSQVLPSSTSVTPPGDITDAPAPREQQALPETREDAEAVRRRTIAERMAKLGGIKFGAAPPVPGAPKRPPPPPQQQEEEERETDGAEGSQEQPEMDEEAEERARKERIAVKLAGMGGMRIGMMPSAFPPRKSHVLSEEPAAPTPPRAPPARVPPPPQPHESESEVEGSTVSEDGVKVEAEESDPEEVHYEDVEEELAPAIPSRASRPIRREPADVASSPPLASSPPTRPPVPSGLPPRRPSTKSVGSQRRVSGESTISPPPPQRKASAPKAQPSEYVMVEEPQIYEEEAPPPLPPNRPAGRRTSGPPTRSPPPPLPEDSISSHWELPTIPTSNLEIGGSDLEMSWIEAQVPPEVDAVAAPPLRRQSAIQSPPQPPSVLSASTQSSTSPSDLHLSADDLMALWGRVGVQVCEAATNLFERSKKGLIGDGTYPGFIHAVIREVPNALPAADYGYLIYKQNGASVQKRASDIMPGDLVELHDVKLKGHKGLQVYHQNVGTEEPVVGVVGEFDAKKSKIKVFQANQHVGQQTVEIVSYRLEDLKSGVVKVYRVLEAQ